MAGEFRLSDMAAQAQAEAFLATLDGGAGAAYFKIYDGTLPADVNTAITTQTLLGTLTLSSPAGSATDGVLTLDAITQDASADADGEMSFARFFDGDDNAICDMAISDMSGAGPIKVNTTTVVAGGPISADDDPAPVIDFHGA